MRETQSLPVGLFFGSPSVVSKAGRDPSLQTLGPPGPQTPLLPSPVQKVLSHPLPPPRRVGSSPEYSRPSPPTTLVLWSGRGESRTPFERLKRPSFEVSHRQGWLPLNLIRPGSVPYLDLHGSPTGDSSVSRTQRGEQGLRNDPSD